MINKLLTPLVLFLLLFSGLSTIAKDFEGIISFRKIDGKDTAFYMFHIKGNNLRVDDINKKEGGLNGTMLLNLDNSSIIMLSGINKFYINVPISHKKPSALDLVVEKTKDKMSVANKKCILWSVTDRLSGAKFEYWVNNKYNYPFFNGMLRILNREDPIAHSWLEMNVDDDFFPMIGIEYNSAGEVIRKIEVISIEEKKLADEIFELPADYELMEGRF
jgi:hypothetical protein